jgi:hypothetical protein
VQHKLRLSNRVASPLLFQLFKAHVIRVALFLSNFIVVYVALCTHNHRLWAAENIARGKRRDPFLYPTLIQEAGETYLWMKYANRSERETVALSSSSSSSRAKMKCCCWCHRLSFLKLWRKCVCVSRLENYTREQYVTSKQGVSPSLSLDQIGQSALHAQDAQSILHALPSCSFVSLIL